VRVFAGIDLGSTTTKAVILDEAGEVLGRGITNSRSNYHLAADIARDEAIIGAHFTLLERAIRAEPELADGAERIVKSLLHHLRKQQHASQLRSLADRSAAGAPQSITSFVAEVFARMEAEAKRPTLSPKRSEFFRDQASSDYARIAEHVASKDAPFDALMSVFDKAILEVENTRMDLSFERHIGAAADACFAGERAARPAFDRALARALASPIEIARSIGTGYGRQTLPFPKDDIRSEILCHGLGAHEMFPRTRTVLDIGGQDTKAIQVDGDGIVTSFQMNDRCAAGCGRYLGYIADEINLGVHELGPLAMESTRFVKINSTCTVFAGAELRDRLSRGQRREDVLAGLHRAIMLRAMALLARSGGVEEELTFTGGVASNIAAVSALRVLVGQNYGERTINISPSSIYTGALGAALFARVAKA
jgi:benzoyl-CoA reductase subunit A